MAWEVLDVSKYQSISDYSAATTSVSGVLIRVGYRGYGASGTLATDTKFKSHYNGFLGNCRIGFYFFSTAITVTEAIEEANYVYNLIKDKECDFPVYFQSDYANASHNGRSDDLSVTDRTTICRAFCDRIKQLGYRAGVFATDYWLTHKLNIQSLYDEQYSLLVVEYNNEPINVLQYDGWQYTSDGVVPKYSGNVKLAHFYRDVANWVTEEKDEPIDINTYTISISETVFTYNGEYITPTITVGNLHIGSDFIVEYANNIDAGIATATITGIGNYKGTATKTFTILPQNISANNRVMQVVPSVYFYSGEEIFPECTIPGLIRGIDYELEFRDNLNIGTAVVTATGMGNYTNTLSGNYKIIAGDITYLEWELETTEYIYDGRSKYPVVIAPDGMTLDEDYNVTYSNNKEIGSGTVVITGRGNFTGTVRLSFYISSADITGNLKITPSEYEYSGLECRPKVTVLDLDESEYTVEYRDNINASKLATVIVYGIKNHTSILSGTFTINPKPLSKVNDIPSILPSEYYTSKYIEPELNIPGLTKGVDYYVRYTNNIEVGTAYITLTGIGNYKDHATIKFNISKVPLSLLEFKYGEPSIKTPYRVDNGELVVTDPQGMILEENKDYHIISETRTKKDQFELLSLIIEGLGNYTGMDTYRYRVIPVEPDNDYADDGVYNFGDINEGDETAVGDYDFGDLDIGVDPDTVAVKDYNFEALADIYTDDYDIDNGTNVDEDGKTEEDYLDPSADDDDGTYNFGDIDLEDETAVGDYDFGDEDEGRDMDSVVVDGDNIDFNSIMDGFPPGKEFELQDTPIYANYCSISPSGTRSGVYFIYKPQIINGMIRITKTENGVSAPSRSTGWVKTEDLERLGKPAVDDPVYVTGKLRRYINSDNETFEVNNEIMYVTMIADETQYEYCYGLAYEKGNSRIGWACLDMLEKPTIIR